MLKKKSKNAFYNESCSKFARKNKTFFWSGAKICKLYNKSKISKHFCAILRCNQRCEITLSSFQTKTCNEPINCSMTFFTRDNQVSRVRIRRIFVHHFVFSLKTADLATLFLLSGVHDRPQRRKGFGSFFTGNS